MKSPFVEAQFQRSIGHKQGRAASPVRFRQLRQFDSSFRRLTLKGTFLDNLPSSRQKKLAGGKRKAAPNRDQARVQQIDYADNSESKK